jgi:hypothetical protein
MNCGLRSRRRKGAALAAPLLLSVMLTAPLRGAVIFTDIPDRPMFSLDEFSFPIDFDSDLVADVVLRSSDIDYVAFSTSTSRILGITARPPDLNHYALPLLQGSLIGADVSVAEWNSGYSGLVACTDVGCLGLWPEQTAYLGVEFLSAGTLHYGWVLIDVPFTGINGGTVRSFAYESEPNTSIIAGAIPEPSSAVLVATGTALLWKRNAKTRKENNRGRSEGEARTFDCTFWLNNPGGRRVAGLMRFVFDRL